MANTFFGLDIGFDSLKLIELRRDKGGLYVTNYFVEPCNIRDIKEITDDKVLEQIENIFRENKIRPSSIVVSISGQSVFTRFVKLPTLDRSKIDQIVQYEAQQQVPFPIDEVIWDYHFVGDWAELDEIDEANVVLVASKKDIIDNLISRFSKLKIDIEYIDTAPFALYNCIKFNEPDMEGCALVLDIGAKSTDMLVIEKDNVWLRSIPIAGFAITQAIASEFKISFEEAEQLKKDSSVILCGKGPMVGEPAERLRISRAVTGVMARLIAEVSRSIGFYRTYSGGGGIKNIFICGGSSKIENIEEFFKSKFNLNVRKLETTRNLDVLPHVENKINGSDYVIGCAVGLALRQATQCAMEINLLPKSIATQQDIAKKKSYIIGCFLLIGLALIAGIFYFKQWIQYDENIAQNLNQDLRQIKSQSMKIDQAKKQIQEINNNFNRLQELQADRVYWVKLLDELQIIMPKNCWLKNFLVIKNNTNNSKSVRISGETTAPLGEIPKIKDILEKSPFFENLKIKSADDLNALGIEGKDIRRFEMIGDLVSKIDLKEKQP